MKKIIIYVFLIIFTFIIIYIINYTNNYFSERVSVYIENKGVVYSQRYIQDALMDSVIDQIDISSMYYLKEDTNNNVSTVLINTAQVNKILGLVNDSLDSNLTTLTEERLKIPAATILGETIFSSFGPDVNIKIIPIGNYKCDIVSTVKEYGINNSLFEIFITINFNIEAIVPLQRIETKVNCKIPIVMQILQGEVPRYYYNTDEIIPDVNDNN